MRYVTGILIKYASQVSQTLSVLYAALQTSETALSHWVCLHQQPALQSFEVTRYCRYMYLHSTISLIYSLIRLVNATYKMNVNSHLLQLGHNNYFEDGIIEPCKCKHWVIVHSTLLTVCTYVMMHTVVRVKRKKR